MISKKKILELASEFASVQIERDDTGNGPRLMIKDMRTGATTYLDPLELEALAWLRHDQLAPFLDPSFSRWRDNLQSGEIHTITATKPGFRNN